MVDPENIPRLMESGVIEVAPLAYMRGRTLNDSFVILDEGQNTTPAQMKMFLTRLGFGSKMVVTGDLSQTDLPHHQESGLQVAQNILRDVPGCTSRFSIVMTWCVTALSLELLTPTRHSRQKKNKPAYREEEVRERRIARGAHRSNQQ